MGARWTQKGSASKDNILGLASPFTRVQAFLTVESRLDAIWAVRSRGDFFLQSLVPPVIDLVAGKLGATAGAVAVVVIPTEPRGVESSFRAGGI